MGRKLNFIHLIWDLTQSDVPKAGNFASDARDYEFTFAHSLGLGRETGARGGDEDHAETEEKDAGHSPTSSEYSVHDDNPDSASGTESEPPSALPSPSPRRIRPLPSHAHSPPPASSSPTSDRLHLSEDEFPLHIPLDGSRPTTPTALKRTHSERVSDTPHASPAKKKLKEKGWSKPKVMTHEEKEDVFIAEADERRDTAEARAKKERHEKQEKEAKRKELQNERQQRHRALKRAAMEAENPGGRKRRKVDLKHRETASQSEVADASRPAREIKKKVKAENRKPAGRKQKSATRSAKYVNWTTPFAWSAITAAQAKVGWGYTNILRALQRGNYDFFQHLAVTTIMGWIETVGGFRQWKPSVLARALKGNVPGHNKGPYPEIVKEIISQLSELHAAGAPLSLATARCIIIAIIREQAPEIFERRFKDGSLFRVSDSKRAFTALLAVSAAGDELPPQCVYGGKSKGSLPTDDVASRQDFDNASFSFVFSGKTRNHWSNQKTMRQWDWLRKIHPDILVDFVPGGCTGIGQPLDVGLNRPFKHAVKRRNGEQLDPDTGLPVLRDASVGWIWQGSKVIQNKELLLKAWAMCLIRSGLNLSYDCMTSFETKKRLVNLRNDNPELWDDLHKKSTRNYCPGDDEEVAEDVEAYEDEDMGGDDSEIPTQEVDQHVVTKKTAKNRKIKAAEGNFIVGLGSSGEAEDADADISEAEEEVVDEREGKRKRRATARYLSYATRKPGYGYDGLHVEIPGAQMFGYQWGAQRGINPWLCSLAWGRGRTV
ncbi:hypothetical protein DFH08DRAFT_821873 [Mycena albidolilacea]|uniref:Uncharacterized protein n=1 Tax=Mycena albidolilacea TaxID=1033008 RepID=A0AAD7EDN5_9AGAR|nr:hypothetical protein DFH08DRAFT_821873 [Mycena albidolilacea]